MNYEAGIIAIALTNAALLTGNIVFEWHFVPLDTSRVIGLAMVDGPVFIIAALVWPHSKREGS